MVSIDELTLATRAAEGDSRCATELRRRVLRCAVSVARKARWLDALDVTELEEDVPNEAVLRLISRIRQGFTGECGQFRSYLYRVVTSVTADAVRRTLDRRKEASLDAPFENAEGGESTLRDFVENEARIGRMADYDSSPEETSLTRDRNAEIAGAVSRLDPWCQILVREAVIAERPHARIAAEYKVTVQMLDVSLKRCTERLYRNLLTAYVNGPDRLRRQAIADAALQLPEDLRQVFLPWWNENASVKQIAARCGLQTDETRRRLSRAKASMWALAGS
ncbi:MAG TPA: sigma-70 family RNA polymerase sigma factor [Armatimonadota bacterium]